MNRMLKNILSGLGSVLILYPASGYSHYRHDSIDLGRSDLDALSMDVKMIGQDFHKAAEQGRVRVTETKEASSHPAKSSS
ncbi:hypothetical protein PX122_26785 [Pseudomonas aeruginosa]|uniref:hypothetical protein n=1 Tax=Pseudomonas aeruginosa TaxID=287 RepID=UPI00163D9C49|nr:hypothetical protein [Pseudomonas aeruginosa]ELV1373904.1 hypothetical protein [Pseudomonas aeruginosa]MCX3418136.1 hypothetical protein [Pseudomonas aeruginosa]HBN9216094.1 hypothetical protein [Pseudomonas aeruginosa]HBO3127099.1 hypothetical protein [Pseudomonas aeruginosa]HCE5930335.1 hypothetical protein [Pseudomonas aeruginosa]